MSQVYRAHSPAQVLGEAVVIAAALLAAVEAAPVPSTTPSRGSSRPKMRSVASRGRRSPSSPSPRSPARSSSAAAASPGTTRCRSMQPYQARRRWWSERLRGLPGRRPRPNASQRQTQRRRLSLSAHRTRPRPPVNSKDWRKASHERASRNDRRNVLDAYAAQTTKTKKATTVAQTRNAPAPAKDPNCNVFLPDNVFMSHHDQFRCFR